MKQNKQQITPKEENPKLLVPAIKNVLRMIVDTIIASVLMVYDINAYVIFLAFSIVALVCLAILRNLSQSIHLYGDMFKDISVHNIMLSILMYLGGAIGPGVFCLVQYLMTKI